MSARTVPLLSPEQYLEIDRASELRHEYYQGHMWAMSGGSISHAYIIANLIGEFRQQLKGSGCRVAASDLRLRVEVNGFTPIPM